VILESYQAIREMDLVDYHAAPYVSSSKLADYAKRGPRYYAARHVTRSTPPYASTEAQIFGQAFEDLVCEPPAVFASRYAFKPEGMTFTTKEGKAWRSAMRLAGKDIITVDEKADLYNMRESLWENETALSMIRNADTQVTFRGPYAGTPGIQARPDYYSAKGCAFTGFRPFTIDLKTTIHFSRMQNGRGVAEYRYHVQAAIARQAANIPELACYLLIVEKCSPYRCQVIALGDAWLDAGWRWADRQLQKLARHYATDTWPRTESEAAALPPPPPWIDEREADEEEAA
jgi:hypothetical protein